MTDDTWRPEFAGQREPFAPGHEKSITHGANSERRIGPLAAEIEAAARSAPGWPPYLDQPAFGPAVTAWARAEAVAELLLRWLDQCEDITAMLAETAETSTTETSNGGRTVKLTRARRVASVLSQLDRWQARCLAHRARLGLDPAAQAKIARDLSAGRALQGLAEQHPLTVALDRKAAERAALAQAERDDERP